MPELERLSLLRRVSALPGAKSALKGKQQTLSAEEKEREGATGHNLVRMNRVFSLSIECASLQQIKCTHLPFCITFRLLWTSWHSQMYFRTCTLTNTCVHIHMRVIAFSCSFVWWCRSRIRRIRRHNYRWQTCFRLSSTGWRASCRCLLLQQAPLRQWSK